jgi:hypothetical protein
MAMLNVANGTWQPDLVLEEEERRRNVLKLRWHVGLSRRFWIAAIIVAVLALLLLPVLLLGNAFGLPPTGVR